MNYLIALVAIPLMMVVWVLVQRWAGYDPDQDSSGGCAGCTCGRSMESCERKAA
jgi:hypothetical protein